MPKLNTEIIAEIVQKFQPYDDKEKSLEKFMVSGKECLEIGMDYICKLDVTKVKITKNHWKFFQQTSPKQSETILYPAERKYRLIFDYDNFLFIKEILRLLPVAEIDVIELKSPNINCFRLLKKLNKLWNLSIICESKEECKVLFKVMSNMKTIKTLFLIVPNSDSKLLDTHFSYTTLTVCHFEFEKNLHFSKPRQEVTRVRLYGNQRTKKAFVFEPKHFVNYCNAFPSAWFQFDIHHTITDADTDTLLCFNNNFFQPITHALKDNSFIRILYYNNETPQKSTLYKKLQSIPKCNSCPFDSPNYKFRKFTFQSEIRFVYPKMIEHFKNCWNQRMMYTQNIPKKYKRLFKPDDFVILQTRDTHGNFALFKCLKDMRFEHLMKYYGKKIGIDDDELSFLVEDGPISYDDTPRTQQLDIHKDLIIEIFPEGMGNFNSD